jgi:hypothetical protein
MFYHGTGQLGAERRYRKLASARGVDRGPGVEDLARVHAPLRVISQSLKELQRLGSADLRRVFYDYHPALESVSVSRGVFKPR